jgi:hypothetical protein
MKDLASDALLDEKPKQRLVHSLIEIIIWRIGGTMKDILQSTRSEKDQMGPATAKILRGCNEAPG